MSTRRVICYECGGEIQRNTPLAQGGITSPALGMCEDCEAAAQEMDEMATIIKERVAQQLDGHAAKLIARPLAGWSREQLERKVAEMFHLLLECRDALPLLTMKDAQQHKLSLTLDTRIEGALEPWRVE